MPSELQNDEEFLNRLGHYWYTDKIFGEFINNMEAKQPQENLFIITGDHGRQRQYRKTAESVRPVYGAIHYLRRRCEERYSVG